MKALITVFLSSLLFFSCSNFKEEKADILVSIAPYKFLVEQITKKTLQVTCVVPAGTNSHFFEPSPNSLKKAANAKVWFRIGEPFEKKLLPALQNQNATLEGEDTLNASSSSSKDIHVWMSPQRFLEQGKVVVEKLSQLYPEKASFFSENFAEFSQKIASLDEKILHLTSPLKKRVLLVSHPALGYFCSDYGFTQLSLEWEGKELSLKKVEELLQTLKKEKPVLVVTMPQHSNKGALYLAKKLNLPFKEIDPYSENYFLTLQDLAETLSKYE